MPEISWPRRAARERKPRPIDAEINRLADAGLLRDGLISHENGRRNLRKDSSSDTNVDTQRH